MKSSLPNLCRMLLADIRHGDFTHAGELAAIDIVIHHLNQIQSDWKNKRVLDAGCGLGGTAFYVSKKLSCEVYGIDLDAAAIDYARVHYPDLKFLRANILEADKIFAPKSFELIYFFNVIYAIAEKQKSLLALANIAVDNALLVIFDYVALTKKPLNLVDFAGKPMLPLAKADIAELLLSSGWSLIQEIDLSAQYIEWYATIINKIESQQSLLIKKFTQQAYAEVHGLFSLLLAKLRASELGGHVFLCEKKK